MFGDTTFVAREKEEGGNFLVGSGFSNQQRRMETLNCNFVALISSSPSFLLSKFSSVAVCDLCTHCELCSSNDSGPAFGARLGQICAKSERTKKRRYLDR